MMAKQNIFYCIDMKSFFASVECAERGLNPFETNLVVSDESRGRGALCLAITPKMKTLGAKNRCRLFEIPKNIKYQIALPRMQKYIDYAAEVYGIYLKYFCKDDIHVYSIDESFIDVTAYLKSYKLQPKELAVKIMNEIANSLRIPSTVGIGTNLYLAKIALDITAKKSKDGVGYLTEELYKEILWEHRPITDFWQVAKGTAARLAKYGIHDMKGVAHTDEALLYKTFGINAELLIDHAWGRESCTIADIKAYKPKSKSVSNSQILFEDYTYEKAKTVMTEMVLAGCQEMMRRKVVSNRVGIGVGYSKDIFKPTGGFVKIQETTNVFSIIKEYVLNLFESTTEKHIPIRRLSISFENVVDESCAAYTLFTNFEAVEKEKKSEAAVLKIKERFGKNALLRAMDLQDGATARIRNKQIGGHNGE